MPNDHKHISMDGVLANGTSQRIQHPVPPMASDEEIVADNDEPPERGRFTRPAPLQLQHTTSFTKSKPRCDVQQSLLTSALQASSSNTSPVEEHSDKSPLRGMSTVSTWSNNSVTTADLTSDGGFTSPVSRASTPSPPPPSSVFRNMIPIFNRKPSEQPISVVTHEDESIEPLQKAPVQPAGEQTVEAVLGRKRCIMFACGKKEEKKPAVEPPKPAAATQPQEPAKRVCTIKFACPTKVSTEAPAQPPKPRARMVSPPPIARRIPHSPKPSPKVHRGSDSTVRNSSPVSVRKAPVVDRPRRLSLNSDLARCEAYRFHEFASSEEEVDEWTLESTCHRNRLTVSDTLKVENGLRQLAEEVEEEAIDEDEDEDEDDVVEDDDDELLEDEDDSDAHSVDTDEGFQTDDENGFAVSDDESDAGSDYNWWAPGASTAATSIEHLEQLRLKTTRTVSESSIASLESHRGFLFPEKSASKRKKTKAVNIRAPSPELPDSTDFICGTLDEDRPLEAAYMANLERRRAAKHKTTPQDIDPTFPASDPELPDEEEDEVSEAEQQVSESDNHFMMHGRMDHIDGEARGRRKDMPKKRSPLPSPKRVRSPPPAKRAVHRSPPPRKLFGVSPKRLHSPPPMRLRSPPPSRRGSVNPFATRARNEMAIRFGGLGERPVPTVSSSVPRTPLTPGPNPLEYDDDEVGINDMPVRRAIDIQVGLEKKRQRRKEQLYRKQHRKAATKEKRPPPPGRGAERMREMGLAAHAHKGKTAVFNPFFVPATPDQKDMHVLSV